MSDREITMVELHILDALIPLVLRKTTVQVDTNLQESVTHSMSNKRPTTDLDMQKADTHREERMIDHKHMLNVPATESSPIPCGLLTVNGRFPSRSVSMDTVTKGHVDMLKNL